MNVRLNPVVGAVRTQASPAPARGEVVQGGPAAAARVAPYHTDSFQASPGTTPQGLASQAQRNTTLEAQLKNQLWASATPIIHQDQPDNCGPAVAAMLFRSKGGGKGMTDAELMRRFESQHSTQGFGTTSDQLSRMLVESGIVVTRGAANFDRDAANQALRNGGKIAAMVDSNWISPGGGDKPPGSAHWVVIDGMDDKGNYLVKDPARGTSSYVGLHELSHAMNEGRNSHGGGGMLLLENTRSAESLRAMGPESGKHTGVVGKKGGGGSNASSSFGRESAG